MNRIRDVLALRIVGGASIILGICIVGLGLNQMGVSKDVAAAVARWGFRVAVVAAVVMLVFPLMSRIFLAKAYAFAEVDIQS